MRETDSVSLSGSGRQKRLSANQRMDESKMTTKELINGMNHKLKFLSYLILQLFVSFKRKYGEEKIVLLISHNSDSLSRFNQIMIIKDRKITVKT